MRIKESYIKGCIEIIPEMITDQRGYFFESFNRRELHNRTGIDFNVVQVNQSCSNRGVLRGLHIQVGRFAQAKLVRVIKGSILDVCVDLRRESETYGQYFSLKLSEQNHKQLFLPRGTAHGFLALEDDTVVNYCCDNYYDKPSERGIRYDDIDLGIDWNWSGAFTLSEKDQNLPSFLDFAYGNKGIGDR